MELREYLILLRRWAWVLVLGLVLGLGAGYAISQFQVPIYQAATKVLVMRAPQERYSDLTYLSDQQLTQTYIQLLTTSPVLDRASQLLSFKIDRDRIRVQQVRDTQVIQVTVEDENSGRASIIANMLVDILIEQNDILQAGRFTASEESIQAQILRVEGQINSLESQIDEIATQSVQDQTKQVENQIATLQAEINQLDSEVTSIEKLEESAIDRNLLADKKARMAQLQSVLTLYQEIYTNLVVLGKPSETGAGDRLTRMQKTLDLYQQIYLQLLSNLENVRLARLQNTPNVVQIEAASVSTTPVRPRPLVNTLLGGAIGVLLAAGVLYLREYLNDTLRTPSDVEQMLGLPIIGYIAEMNNPKRSKDQLYVARQPRSPVSEAFRSLRTNLEFAGARQPLKSILITSSRPGEGKTTIATNLAAIYAQGGKRVVLLDADLRRPCIHRFLGIPNRVGLSTLFRDNLNPNVVIQRVGGIMNLLVITSGSLPPNPAELLGSDRMFQILQTLQGMADIIIVDSPPSLVADTQVMAAKVDGVLFVVQPGQTQAVEAQATMEQFARAGARMLGVTFNRIPRNRSQYYGGYQYYSPKNPYYSDNGAVSEAAKLREVKSISESGLVVDKSFAQTRNKPRK